MSVCMVVSLTLLAVQFDIAYAQASLQHNACSSAYRRAHMHIHTYMHFIYVYVCMYDCCGCNFLEKVLAKMARECQARGRAEIYAAVLEYAG